MREVNKGIVFTTLDFIFSNTGILPVSFAWAAIKEIKNRTEDTRAKRSDEWVQFLFEKWSLVRQQLLNDPEYNLAFVQNYQSNLAQRIEEKRDLIKKNLVGFLNSEDYKKYELERNDNTINLISLEAINFLKFVIQTFNINDRESLDKLILSNKLNDYFRSQPGVEYSNTKKEELKTLQDSVSELVSLGILKYTGYVTVGSMEIGNFHFTFTQYGKKFVENLFF